MSDSEAVSSAPTLLVIDDDDNLRTRLLRAFENRGYESTGASTLAEGLSIAESMLPEFVLLDLRLGDGHALGAIETLHSFDEHTRIVVFTGYGSIATALEAMRLGAHHYLTKPADVSEIIAAFGRVEDESFLPDGESDASTPTLARVEWEHIQRVLTDCGGNVSEAARRLGIHRRSLQRKLAKHPLPR